MSTATKRVDESFLSSRYTLRENFEQIPQLNASITADTANRNFEILGTNAGNNNIGYSTGGGVLMTTGFLANDQVILLPHLDVYQTAWTVTTWGTGDSCRFESTVKTGASIASINIWAGLKLTNTGTVATDNDQVMFRFDPTVADSWTLVSSRSGTDTTAITGVTVAASTSYKLAIEIESDRTAHAYINDVQVTRFTKLAALTADVSLIPYVGVQTTTGATKNLTCRYIECSKAIS